MSMLKMPPGRTSISTRATRPQALGMYHSLRCSGLVNASQTRRAGASMNRSMAKSSFGSKVDGMLMMLTPSP
jgi:hypothetical protein